MPDSESSSIRQLYSLGGNSTYFLVITLTVLAAFVARSFTLFTASIDADEGVYLVMAQQWQHGGLPYIAVWNQHPPRLARHALEPDPLALTRAFAGDAISHKCVRRWVHLYFACGVTFLTGTICDFSNGKRH
jgi:hypothetical protein